MGSYSVRSELLKIESDTRYAVSDICTRSEVIVLIAGYAGPGTQGVIYSRKGVVLVAGFVVPGTQGVIYTREEAAKD